jgi:uncharacterized protein
MEYPQFTYHIFSDNIIALLAYLSLALATISLWIKKTAWLWGAFLLIAFVLAFQSDIITPLALLPIGILFVCQKFLTRDIYRPLRFILFGIVMIVSLALSFHFLPGFHNWKIASDMQLSPGALPYTLFLNFDKPFSGFFVLALSLPLIQTRKQLTRMLAITLPATVIGILIMVVISLQIGMIAWDPKLPAIIIPWLFANLLFVSLPEEAFFRGFIQRELYQWFGKTKTSAVGSVLITSFFFVLLHLIWVGNFFFLCLVFIASVIYGTLYQMTKTIESSILCHFLFNVTHFLLFSYPALQKLQL